MIVVKLLDILKERNISQAKFIKDTGIAKTTLEQWKKGSIPSADKIIKIVNYLEISADELLGIDASKIDIKLKQHMKNYNKLNEIEKLRIDGIIEGILLAKEPESKEEELSNMGKSCTSKIG